MKGYMFFSAAFYCWVDSGICEGLLFFIVLPKPNEIFEYDTMLGFETMIFCVERVMWKGWMSLYMYNPVIAQVTVSIDDW